MSYVSISAQIVAILNAVTGIGVVYDYEPKELVQYPAVTVTAVSHENLFNDTAGNKRQYSFTIRAYYRTDNAQNGEEQLRTVVDSIITALETNVTLNAACDFAMPTTGRWLYIEREVPLRVCELSLIAIKRVTR